MKKATLVFPIQNNQILLSFVHKQDKPTSNTWNGYGGKLEGDDPHDRAVLELEEEVGLKAVPEDLDLHAIVNFFFGEETIDPAFRVAIYFLRNWSGIPIETNEMSKPTWYDFGHLPYAEMMPGDRELIPHLLAGETFEGNIIFSEDGKSLISFSKENKSPESLVL